jgi:hypothetical protein
MMYFLNTWLKDNRMDFWFTVVFRIVIVLWLVALVIAAR